MTLLRVVVQTLGKEHPMLRTTFHLDAVDQSNRPFMAVHSQDTAVQSFEIMNGQAKLSSSLRRSFDLSSEFPVRWVILHDTTIQGGKVQTTYRLFAVGHHIAVDGFSLSLLSKQILRLLEPTTEQPTTGETGLSYGEYVQRQVRSIFHSQNDSIDTCCLGCILEKHKRTSCKRFLDVADCAHYSFLVDRTSSRQAQRRLPPHAHMGVLLQRGTAEMERALQNLLVSGRLDHSQLGYKRQFRTHAAP